MRYVSTADVKLDEVVKPECGAHSSVPIFVL